MFTIMTPGVNVIKLRKPIFRKKLVNLMKESNFFSFHKTFQLFTEYRLMNVYNNDSRPYFRKTKKKIL